MAVIGSLAVTLRADTADFERGMLRSQQFLAQTAQQSAILKRAFAEMNTQLRESTQAQADMHRELAALHGEVGRLEQTVSGATYTLTALAGASAVTGKSARDLYETLASTFDAGFHLPAVDFAGFLASLTEPLRQAKERLDTFRADLARTSPLTVSPGGGFTGGGTQSLTVARDIAGAEGQTLETTVRQLGELQAATRGTALEGKDTLVLYQTLAEAQHRYGASVTQTSAVLKVYEEIIRSGTLNLSTYRQLLLAMPDAAGIMERALGKNRLELEVFLQKGVDASQALRSFTRQLAAELPAGLSQSQQGVNKLTLEIEALKARWGETGWIANPVSAWQKATEQIKGYLSNIAANWLHSFTEADEQRRSRTMELLKDELSVASPAEAQRLLELRNKYVFGQVQRSPAESTEFNDLLGTLSNRFQQQQKGAAEAARRTGEEHAKGLDRLEEDRKLLVQMHEITSALPEDWNKLNQEVARSPFLLEKQQASIDLARQKAQELRQLIQKLGSATAVPADVDQALKRLDQQAKSAKDSLDAAQKAKQDAEAMQRAGEALLSQEKANLLRSQAALSEGARQRAGLAGPELSRGEADIQAMREQYTGKVSEAVLQQAMALREHANAAREAKEATDAVVESWARSQKQADTDLDQLRALAARLRDTSLEREVDTAAKLRARLATDDLRYAEALELEAEIDARARVKELREEYKEWDAALEKRVEKYREATRELERYQTQLSLGAGGRAITPAGREFAAASQALQPLLGTDREAEARQVLQRLKTDAIPVFGAIEKGAQQMTDTLTNSFVEMATTGKASFANLEQSFTRFVLSTLAGAFDFQGTVRNLLGQAPGQGNQGTGLFGLLSQVFPSLATPSGATPAADIGTSSIYAGATSVESGGLSIGVGAMQHGGPVFSRNMYLVGERGPELFVPGQSGTIVPNGQLPGMGQGQAPIIHMTVHTTDADSFRRSQRQIARELGRQMAVHSRG